MSSKILMPQLVTMLAAASGQPKKNAEAFIKAFFGTVAETLEEHETLKIKGFGTFKVNRVDARKSVNVSTGAEVRIPPHYKIVFTPAKTMADRVNREFAWLDIVELSDNVSNEEIDSVEKAGEEIPETGDILNVAETEVTALTEQEEERSEQLGEELEKDFGDIEPVEPFGPVDPDDPEPGEPIPEDIVEVPEPEPEPEPEVVSEPEPVTVPEPEIEPEAEPVIVSEPEPEREPTPEPIVAAVPEVPAEPEAVSEPETAPEVAAVVDMDPNFDPYAQDQPQAEEETPPPVATPEEPYYVTRDEFDNLVTKADLRALNRNIKRVKVSVEKIDEKGKKRTRKAFIWSLVICAALMVGGFFLVYGILMHRFHGGARQTSQADAETSAVFGNYDGEDDEMVTVQLGQNDSEDIVVEETETETVAEQPAPEPEVAVAKAAPATASTTTTAPTSPSDIKAMDKITTTRYLTTMAKEHYGNYNLWPYIYIENEGKLGHPDRIKPGTTVVIPNIEKYGINPSNPKDIEKARKLGVEIYRKFAH